ncbi:MAG: HlyD family efflux transporter periplasmic adaptor subunit [Pseudomonadota bacterium]
MPEPAEVHNIGKPADGIRDTTAQDVVREAPRQQPWRWVAATIIVIAIVAALIPVLRPWFGTERSVARSQLRLATVTRQTFVRDVSAQGTVVAAVAPTLFAGSPGTVTLLVRAGDTVNEGDQIARIDSPQLNNERERELASLNSLNTNLQRQTIENKKLVLATEETVDLARIQLTSAERELRRATQSWEYQVISRQDFEKATDDVEKARVSLAHAERSAALDKESLAFELETLRLQRDRQALVLADVERKLAELTLSAPVDGIVGDLAVQDRAFVEINAPVATVIDLSRLEVELQIPASYADSLALGNPVNVLLGNRDIPGQLVSISPEVTGSTVVGRVRFDDEQTEGLRQNQRVTARIILEQRDNALVVKRGPFYDTGAGRLIYRVEDDVAELTPIQTGATSIQFIEIVSGLNEGDVVVISELDRFRDAERALLRD